MPLTKKIRLKKVRKFFRRERGTVADEETLKRIRVTPVTVKLLAAHARIRVPPGKWLTLVLEAGKSGSQ